MALYGDQLVGAAPLRSVPHTTRLKSSVSKLFQKHCRNSVMIAALPQETWDQILGYLSYEDWYTLRLVTWNFNAFCRAQIWKKVLVTEGEYRYHDSDVPLWRFDADNWCPSDRIYERAQTEETIEGCGGVKLTYETIQQLGKDKYFQSALKNTRDLHIIYNPEGADSYHAFDRTYKIIGSLLAQVRRVGVSYPFLYHNAQAASLQALLNRWKPTAKFYLDIRAGCRIDGHTSLNISGMDIRGIHIICERDCVDREIPLLSLSKKMKKGGAPVELTELATIVDNLEVLSVKTDYDMFGLDWIPDGIKYLRLRNRARTFSDDTKLTVPSGVEYLHIEDRNMFQKPSILSIIDQSKLPQLKTLSYTGDDIPKELAPTILEVGDTLEQLMIRCDKGISSSALKSLASAGLGLKRLRLSIGYPKRGGPELSEGSFPELEELLLDLEIEWQRVSDDDRPRRLKRLLAGFLRGCPKLACLQVGVGQADTCKKWGRWITPNSRYKHVTANHTPADNGDDSNGDSSDGSNDEASIDDGSNIDPDDKGIIYAPSMDWKLPSYLRDEERIIPHTNMQSSYAGPSVLSRFPGFGNNVREWQTIDLPNAKALILNDKLL